MLRRATCGAVCRPWRVRLPTSPEPRSLQKDQGQQRMERNRMTE